MEGKESRGLSVVVCVLIILLLVLVGLVGALIVGKNTDKAAGNQGEKNWSPIEKEKQKDEQDVNIVINGIQMRIPPDYGCFYYEEAGPVVYLDDVFQMKLAVREESYTETKKEPERLTEKTVKAGGEIIGHVREMVIDGREYIYFRMRLYDDDCIVVYTQAADTDKSIAGQMVIESEQVTDKELLHVFADIVDTAEVTNEPDSAMEDIINQTAHSTRKTKKKSNLRFKGESVTFKVPEGFYSEGSSDMDSYMTECFLSEDYRILIDCYLWSSETGDYKNAQEYMSVQQYYVDKEIQIQKTDVEGRTCYYIVRDYQSGGVNCQDIYAACDVGEHGIFAVEVKADYAKQGLFKDVVREFFVWE